MQQPGDRQLIHARVLLLRHRFHHTALQGPAAADRRPRHKTKPLFLAILQRVLPFPVCDVVLVLHRRDRHNLARALDLFRPHIR